MIKLFFERVYNLETDQFVNTIHPREAVEKMHTETQSKLENVVNAMIENNLSEMKVIGSPCGRQYVIYNNHKDWFEND